MTGTKELVERLRKIADASRRADGTDIPLGQELRSAADAIERLERERDEAIEYGSVMTDKYRRLIHETGPALVAKIDAAEAEAVALHARVARLEEALKYIKREAGDRSEKVWFRLDTIMDEADAALTEEPKP